MTFSEPSTRADRIHGPGWGIWVASVSHSTADLSITIRLPTMDLCPVRARIIAFCRSLALVFRLGQS